MIRGAELNKKIFKKKTKIVFRARFKRDGHTSLANFIGNGCYTFFAVAKNVWTRETPKCFECRGGEGAGKK